MTQRPVPGLIFEANYLSPDEEVALLTTVDQYPWDTTLRRRRQHHGYIYPTDRPHKHIWAIPGSYLGPLPDPFTVLATRFVDEGRVTSRPDEVLINEYEPGQGISPHADCPGCFTDTVLSLSLGSPCVMEFRHPQSGLVVPVLLAPRSLLAMTRDARYVWRHSIAARKTDVFENELLRRGRRVSVTFRTVRQDGARA